MHMHQLYSVLVLLWLVGVESIDDDEMTACALANPSLPNGTQQKPIFTRPPSDPASSSTGFSDGGNSQWKYMLDWRLLVSNILHRQWILYVAKRSRVPLNPKFPTTHKKKRAMHAFMPPRQCDRQAQFKGVIRGGARNNSSPGLNS